MDDKIKAALAKSSECRSRLNELATATEPDSAALETAQKEYEASEVEVRAALAADDADAEVDAEVDAEARERTEIRSRSKLANFVMAALNGQQPNGAEGELSAAYGCPAGQFPVELLMGAAEPRVREIRALTPGVTAPGATAGITPVIFERTAAASLGVAFPVVESGSASYPGFVDHAVRRDEVEGRGSAGTGRRVPSRHA